MAIMNGIINGKNWENDNGHHGNDNGKYGHSNGNNKTGNIWQEIVGHKWQTIQGDTYGHNGNGQGPEWQ